MSVRIKTHLPADHADGRVFDKRAGADASARPFVSEGVGRHAAEPESALTCGEQATGAVRHGNCQVNLDAPMPFHVEPPRVRLNPVELRNLGIINDPALEGVHVEGRGAEARDFFERVRNNEAPDLRVGDFRYAVRPDGSARLMLYEGRNPIVRIPAFADGHPVCELEPHLFSGHPEIESVVVDDAEAFFSTDGRALYSEGGERFEALVVPCKRYRIADGCRIVADHAFDSIALLESVDLPATVASIGRLAFAKSGLRCVDLPASVRTLGEKAFYICKQLSSCRLNNGLASIGAEAFASSGIERVEIPASVRTIGERAFLNTPAQRGLFEGCIAFAPDATRFELDAEGGLYRNDEFVELIGLASDYVVRSGTRVIAPAACRRNATLRRIALPEGVVSIGAEAFRGCRLLAEVDLPNSLESIGAKAFLDTAIRSLRIGPRVGAIGEAALLVQGEQITRATRTLQHVEVDEGNARFYVESGLLCERAGDGVGDVCLLYVGPEGAVRIPEAVTMIAPFAFSGATAVEDLFVHDHLRCVCGDAFAMARAPRAVHVAFGRAVDGCTGGTYALPSLSARYRNVTQLIEAGSAGTSFNFAYYDSWVSHTSDIAEFATAAAARLANPVLLSDRTREIMEGILRRRQSLVCRHFAARGDIASLRWLMDAGLIDKDTVAAELDAATRAGNAQTTACLLEISHERADASGIDFSL